VNLKRDDDLMERTIQNEKIIMTDGCLPFKLGFIVATWAFACYIILYVRDQSPELSQAQNDTLFTAWVVAIFGSMLIHNPLRILLASCLVEGLVSAEVEGEGKSMVQGCCSFLFVPLEAKKLFIFYGQVQEAKTQMKKAATVRTALEQHIAKTEDKKGKR